MAIPPRAIVPALGVDMQATPVLNQGGWSASSLIRFFPAARGSDQGTGVRGYLQKLGGCSRLSNTPFTGVCRGLFAWSDLVGNSYAGIGTNQRLQVIVAGNLYDITPVRAVSSLAGPFTTTTLSPIVSVADTVGVIVGDWIGIDTATYIDGLFLQGFYQVTALIAGGYQFNAGANAIAGVSGGGVTTQFTTTTSSHIVDITLGAYVFTNGQSLVISSPTTVGGITIVGPYTVTVSSGPVYSVLSVAAATSSATAQENGGQVAISYLIHSAVESGGNGNGAFGQGPFGQGPFGVASGPPPIGGFLRQWAMDAWGEDLLAGIVSGPIYTWTPPVSQGNVATSLANAPPQNTGFFVNAPNQQVIAYGCTDPNTGLQDPMLVRFTDVGNNTDWTATATNQAGSYRLTNGNQIVSGLASGGLSVLWTDVDMWIMQYLGFPLVYGFFRVARSVGSLCQRGPCLLGSIVYWPGQDGFYQYDGASASPLPCSVWDFVYQNIDPNNLGAAFSAVDSLFNEFFFFFPTIGENPSNGLALSYVKYNQVTGVWDCGTFDALARSAWTGVGTDQQPLGADYNGLVQVHENATDLDGAAMDSWAQTGWMALSEGDEYVTLKWFLPDFIMTGGSVLVTLLFSDYADTADPNNPVRTYGPYTITSTTPYVWVNGRGRYFAMKVESVGHGVFWRLGRCRAILQPDGRR